MPTIGTYRSNSSSTTNMLVEWTSLSATSIRINTTYMLGSSTGLYDGNSRNLVVEIRSSGGALLGSANVEVKDRYTFWYASNNYYGQATVNIPYQSGGTLKVTVKTIVGAYSTGVGSCIWDATAGTNYPNQVDVSWPVYNTAPYWGSATAAIGLSGTIPENTTSLTVTWGAATDDQGDTLYYDVYRVGSAGTVLVASGLTARSFSDNIGSGNSGAWYEYHIFVNDGSLWGDDSLKSNRVTKNVFTHATLASSSAPGFATTAIAFTWAGASNTNGVVNFTYWFSSGDITVYNAGVPVTGSSYSIPIWRTGDAVPAGPYVKFDDIKTKLASTAYAGTLTFRLTTTNDYFSSGISSKTISVYLPVDPSAFSVNAPTGTYTIAGAAYFIPDRKAISLSWSASIDLLGGSIIYDVQVSLGGAAYETIRSGLTGLSTSITFSQMAAATSCTFRVIARTSYGKSRTVTASAITLHYYLPPTITITGLDRQTTSVNVTATVGFRSSIAGAKTVTAASFIGKSGTATNLTASASLSITETLTEAQTYIMTIRAQDAGGVGVGTDLTSVTLTIPKYAPMLSVREKGVAVNDVADSDTYIFKVKGRALIDQDNAGIGGLVINVAAGQAPLVVNSTTLVANFNADLLDGNHASIASNANTVPIRNASGVLYAKGLVVEGGVANAILGYTAASWVGSTTYPTLMSSIADRWVMHLNPHVVYTQNGQRGYTGTTYGANIRFEKDISTGGYWDLGVLNDQFRIGRLGTNLFTIDLNGTPRVNGSLLMSDIPSTAPWGGYDVSRTKSGYSGFHFTAGGNVFMVRDADGLSGIMRANQTWAYYFDGNGRMEVGSIPWARVVEAPAFAYAGHMAAGSGTVSSSWASVSFGKTFPAVPKVVASYNADFAGDSGIIKVRNVTTTGFQWVIGGSFTARNADWIAIL